MSVLSKESFTEKKEEEQELRKRKKKSNKKKMNKVLQKTKNAASIASLVMSDAFNLGKVFNSNELTRNVYKKIYNASHKKDIPPNTSSSPSPPPMVHPTPIYSSWIYDDDSIGIDSFPYDFKKPVDNDEVSVTSSEIDFDKVEFSPLPWEQERPRVKIFGFDLNGNLIEEKSPPNLFYAFADERESEQCKLTKLFDYQSRINCARIYKDFPELKKNAPKKMKEIEEEKSETVEDYIRALKENKTDWKSEIKQAPERTRTRRKIKEGSYPNGSVEEDKLPNLLRFTWKGKMKKLTEYLSDPTKHCKINRQDNKGRTSLHYAASWGCKRTMVELLKVPSIKLNMKDQHDMTPLFKAIEINSLECVKLLVEAGANISITCRDGRNALDYAVQEFGDERVSIVEYLLTKTSVRSLHSPRRMSLLHKACLAKRSIRVEKVMEMLITKGCNVDAFEGNGRTPLMLAAMVRRPEILRCLLQHFASVKKFDDDFKTVFSYAKEGTDCYELLRGSHGNVLIQKPKRFATNAEYLEELTGVQEQTGQIHNANTILKLEEYTSDF